MDNTSYGYRDNALSNECQEMNNLRDRVFAVEQTVGIARAWKRVAIGLIVFGATVSGASGTYVAVSHRASACHDEIVRLTDDKVVSCSLSNQRGEPIYLQGQALVCRCER